MDGNHAAGRDGEDQNNLLNAEKEHKAKEQMKKPMRRPERQGRSVRPVNGQHICTSKQACNVAQVCNNMSLREGSGRSISCS